MNKKTLKKSNVSHSKGAVKTRKTFTAIYEKMGKWYVGYVEEIPGVNTQGKTLREAKANLREALELILETNRTLSRSELHSSKVIREPVAVNQ